MQKQARSTPAFHPRCLDISKPLRQTKVDVTNPVAVVKGPKAHLLSRSMVEMGSVSTKWAKGELEDS